MSVQRANCCAIVQYGLIGGEEVARTAAQAPGFVGMIAGFAVYETPHVPLASGSKYLLFGDNEAISYASQITEIEALRLQTTFANAIRGLLLHDRLPDAARTRQNDCQSAQAPTERQKRQLGQAGK